MTQDYYQAEKTQRYDIPLTHLDYSYIKDCTDVKELEKILRVLRSGDEGHYPELEKEAEKRLEMLNPKSRVLRKDNPAMRASDLDKSEQEDIESELETWRNDMAVKEKVLGASITEERITSEEAVFEEDANLPPIRSGKVISLDGKIKEEKPANNVAQNKKVMPRSYKEWDKFDVDKELEQADEETAPEKTTPQPSSFKPDRIASKIDTKGMTDEEMRAKAIREKEKGNEAFHAHDYEESILYYSRSISIAPLAATYNNRALAYLRLSSWNDAINDCDYVLKLEPQNIKALLRRGTAYKGREDYVKARADLDLVLSLESVNKKAQDLLKEISKLEKKASKEAEERKQKGRRMVIEEVDGTDEDEEDAEEVVVETPDGDRKPTAVVNGYTEDTMSAETSESVPVVTEVEDQTYQAAEESEEPPQTEDTQQEGPKDSNTGEGAAVIQEVGSEEEVQSAQKPESAPADQKPKLVATNILSTQGTAPNNTDTEDLAPQDKVRDEESGDSEQIKAGVSEDAGETEASSTPVAGSAQTGSTEADKDAEEAVEEKAEPEPEHSRPVLIQKAFPAAEAALREEGNNFFRTGQYPEAIDVYQKIINKLQTDPDQVVNLSLIYSNQAACYLKIGDSQAAIKNCNTSLELVPHSIKPLLRKAAAYETLERYCEAYVEYKHVLSIDPSIEQAQQGASRSQTYLTNTHGHRWRDKLAPLVRVSPWDVPVIVDENAAGEKVSTPQLTKASSENPSALKEVPLSDATGAQAPSQMPETKPSPDAAGAQAPSQMPETKPSPEEQFEATKAEGNKHVQKGEYEAAVKCYCQCVKLFPDRAAVFTNRALCYLKLNQAQEAEDDCTTALALEPKNFKAWYRRALSRKAQKHYKDSLQDLLQLLRLEPNNSAAKKEMEVIKGLYKKEYDQLKAQPSATDKKKTAEPEKKRKRMKIEEVDDDSGTEEKPHPVSASKSKSSGVTKKSPSSTPSHSGNATKATTSSPPPPAQSTPATDSKHTNARTPESRKPGRGKSKKGSVKETSVGLPVTPPSTPKLQGKITPFEFIQHWNSLKQAKEIQPYVQLLEQISPDDLPGVISNKLDGHMLQIITRCAAHDAQTGEVERAYSILRNIRHVPRFSTVVMFLSNKEKQDIRKVLESGSILGTHSTEEVAAVRKDYGLK